MEQCSTIMEQRRKRWNHGYLDLVKKAGGHVDYNKFAAGRKPVIFPDEPRFQHDSESGEFIGHNDLTYRHPELGKKTIKQDTYIYPDDETGDHVFLVRSGDERDNIHTTRISDIHNRLENPEYRGPRKHLKDLLQNAKQKGYDISKKTIKEQKDDPAQYAGKVVDSLATPIKLDTSKIFDVDIEGIDRRDHPDYSDAFISDASYEHAPGKFRQLTPEELDHLNDNEREFVYNQTLESLY